MRRRIALVLLLLLLMTVAAWMTLRDRPYDGPTPPAATAASAPLAAAPATAERAPETPRRRVSVQRSGSPTDSAEPAADPTSEPVFVLIVRRSDTDAGVAGLLVRSARNFGRRARTNTDGYVEFAALAGEDSLDVTTPAPGAEQLTLRLGATIVRVPPPVPLVVRWVDAETGGAVEPIVGLDLGCVTVGLLSDEPSVEEDRPGATSRVFDNAPLWPGTRYDLAFDVSVPGDKWVAPPQRTLTREGTLSRYAERAEVLLPIPRSASIRAAVLDSRGDAVAGARVRATSTGVSVDGETGANGEAIVAGLPFYRGESVRVSASLPGRPSMPRTTVLRDVDLVPTVELQVVDAVASGPSVIGIGGGAGGAFGGRRGGRRVLRAGGDGTPVPSGVLIVRIIRRDGTPAPQAAVTISGPGQANARTDATGTVRFEHLRGGNYLVACAEHGLSAMQTDVALGTDETLQVFLEEPSGTELRVRVVDSAGHALPHARLSLYTRSDRAWVQLEDGVQHLDVHTDAPGEALLLVAPDVTKVNASYGSRKAETTRRDEDRWPDMVTITIPD